jgi:hypothetical protein
MPQTLFPIVGSFFRPPAKALISVLPMDTPLILLAEPDNPYDPNAVAVWLNMSTIPEELDPQLEEALAPFGFDLTHIRGEENLHLGYIPKEKAKELRQAEVIPNEGQVSVTFALSASGSPMVRFPSPVL